MKIFSPRHWLGMVGLIIFLLTVFEPTPVLASDETSDAPTIVYFYEALCEGCQELDRLEVVETLEAAGINVIIKDLALTDALERFAAYNDFFRVPNRLRSTPIMFAGEQYFSGANTIYQAVLSGELIAAANEPLLDVPDEFLNLTGFAGLVRVVIAGLIDSVNPCAIAMLLMFISLVGVLKDRKMLIIISASYISAIFVTYFLIGLFFLGLMRQYATQINAISTGLYIGFAVLCLFLAVITFYDFWVTRNQDYGKVKNQLPKVIQRFNKRFMSRFTQVITEEEHSTVKKYTYAVIIPLFIGIVVAFTEAACTGQVYGLILLSIRTVPSATGYLYLVIFNLLFVSPLIIIAGVAIYSKNVVGISNFVREKMPTIKLATAIFFVFMMFYFLLDAFNISIIRMIMGVF